MSCQNLPPSPACLGPGSARACKFCKEIAQRNELSKRLAGRLQTVEKVYSREVAQLCAGQLAQWHVHYTLSTEPKGNVLIVKVLIHVVDGSGAATSTVRGKWSSMVGTVWNNKAQLTVPVYDTATAVNVAETLTRTVVFALEWTDSATANAYDVTCNKSMTTKEYIAYFEGLPANERSDLVAYWRLSQPKLRDYSATDPEWKKLQYLQDVPRDATRHGTPHIGEWGDDDREAVQHEFGHAIGLPDEYLTTNYWLNEPGGANFVEIPLDLAIYNLDPFTSKSLMNNTMSRSGSKLYSRHFDLLAKDFEDLVRTQLAGGRHVKAGSARVQMIA